jgi:hypothetical protein
MTLEDMMRNVRAERAEVKGWPVIRDSNMCSIVEEGSHPSGWGRVGRWLEFARVRNGSWPSNAEVSKHVEPSRD